MDIVEYMARGDGSRSLGVRVGDVSVVLTPSGAESQKAARQIALRIVDAETDAQATQLAMSALQRANESLAARVRGLRAQVEDGEMLLKAALTGKRRLFGRVLMRVEPDGCVWLLQPGKRESGFGLRFRSLAECRSAHPELWPTGDVDDGYVVMDGCEYGGDTAQVSQ